VYHDGEPMPLVLAAAVFVPLIGALAVLGLSMVPRSRPYLPHVALGAAVLATVLTVVLQWAEPAYASGRAWQPAPMAGLPLGLASEYPGRLMAMAISAATASALLAAWGRQGSLDWPLASMGLAMLGASLVSALSANILTLMIGWSLHDMISIPYRLRAGGLARRAIAGLAITGLATLSLWAGTAVEGYGRVDILRFSALPSSTGAALWTLAGLLRLSAYPFHLGTADDLKDRSGLAIPVLLGPFLGWALWGKLSLLQPSLPTTRPGVLCVAASTLVAGAFLACTRMRNRRAVPWIGVAGVGLILLAAEVAGGASIAAVGGLAWTLGMTSLYLSDGFDRATGWWNAPGIIGGLALLGVPPTLGFAFLSSIVRGLSGEAGAWLGAVIVVGSALLVAALVRWLMRPALRADQPGDRRLKIARAAGVSLPAVLLVLGGAWVLLAPGQYSDVEADAVVGSTSLAGWLVVGAGWVGGALLTWQRSNLSAGRGLLIRALHGIVRLEWLYRALQSAVDRGLALVRAADEILGGTGAVLWSFVLLLLVAVLWSGTW
jgi:formate hydrogenlyase subunit 3/multisubunit Na+/H+ antiporter MnhD subunit